MSRQSDVSACRQTGEDAPSFSCGASICISFPNLQLVEPPQIIELVGVIGKYGKY